MIVGHNELEGTAGPLSAMLGLASSIMKATESFTTYLDQHKLCNGDLVAGSCSVSHDAPTNIAAARTLILEATTCLQQLIMSPTDFNLQCTVNLQQMASYKWLVSYRIPNHVPADAHIDYRTLAQNAQVPEDHLIRLARLAMTGGFFHEPTPGCIAHTPISSAFRADGSLRDSMLLLTDTNLPTATKIVDMTNIMEQHPTPKVTKTAFQLAHNTELSFFPYLSKNPALAKRLASGMRTVANSPEASPVHLLNAFDWTSLPDQAHVIDLGGSHGHISLFLARHYPNLRFTVQDLPPVVASAPAPPAELKDRVQFHAHSFLEPQPAGTETDIFLIRQCLNNWPNATAIQILRNLVPSLTKPHSRILINNTIVPAPFSTLVTSAAEREIEVVENKYYGQGLRNEALARTRDAAMLQLMDGAERDLEQWQAMIKSADERLEIVALRKPEGSLLSVLEVKLADQ